MANLFKYGEVEWSLPLLFQYEPVYGTIYKLFKEYDINLPKANLYGAPACRWSGGRTPTIYKEYSIHILNKLFSYIKELNAVPTFTFSRTQFTKDDLKDKYCNFILNAAIDVNARFIVYSDILRDYIKEKNSNVEVVASCIKPTFQFQGPQRIEEQTPEAESAYYNKLLKEYDLVVARPEYSKTTLVTNPELIDDISRIEVLINQTCISDCPKAVEHYKFYEKFNSRPDRGGGAFTCAQSELTPQDTYRNNLSHSQEIVEKLVSNGIKHLKLQGRGTPLTPFGMLFMLIGQMYNQDGDNNMIIFRLTNHMRLAAETDTFVRYIDWH